MENKIQSKDFPKKGGRPRIFDSQMEAVLEGSFPDKTHRSLQNKFFLLRAFRLVKNDPALKWLYDKEAQTIKSVILTELGRIAGDGDLLNLARQVCTLKPRTRDGILLIRTWRKSKKAVTPSARVNENLSPIGNIQTIHESQIRPLAHPEPEEPKEEGKDPEEPKGEALSRTFAIWNYDEDAPKL
jgi:hypothetical protein